VFYDLGKLDQIAVNLFYGWGYNFYRQENQLRADDLMVRSKASWMLGICRQVVETQQSAYRRKFIPPPTREKPLPEPDALEKAGILEAMSASIGKIEGIIRAMPVPENDRITQRYRQEAETLVRLREIDCHLIGQTETLRRMIELNDYDFLLEHAADIKTGFDAITQTIRDRQGLLQN
jgi:hypothetical protein